MVFERIHRFLARIPFRYRVLFTIQSFVVVGISFHRKKLIEDQGKIRLQEIEADKRTK